MGVIYFSVEIIDVIGLVRFHLDIYINIFLMDTMDTDILLREEM